VFKQSKLAAAVLAAVATTGVQAVNLSANETGEVLIFPFYNTNNGFVTQISLTNTQNQYKIVKVRFRESKESNDTLDFNIYFSPFDSWTAIVRDNPANGKANIVTTDETCTYPAKSFLQEPGTDFIDLYTAVDADDTSEGYFEVIEVGNIADGTGPAIDNDQIAEINVNGSVIGRLDGTEDISIPAGLKHDSDGMPEDCNVVFAAWAAGETGDGGFTRGALNEFGFADDDLGGLPVYGSSQGLNDGVVAPTGGLTGYAIHLQASTGAAFVSDPAVIDNYAFRPQHYRPDDADFYLLPSLASGDSNKAVVPTELGFTAEVDWPTWNADPGLVDDIAPNEPKVSGQNPGPIAHVLNVLGISNDYFVEPGAVAGATDWVITFPMKKHGVFNSEVIVDGSVDLGEGLGVIGDWCDTDNDGDADEGGSGPYSCPYGDTTAPVNGLIGSFDETIDVEFVLKYWDREESFFLQAPDAPGFSPVIDPEQPTLTLDREVNVLTWSESGGTTDSVLGTPSDNVFSVVLQQGFTGGWAAVDFVDRYNLGSTDTPFFYVYDLDVDDPFDVVDPGDLDVYIPGIFGVPAIGFAAIRGTVGTAGASGETIPHTYYRSTTRATRPNRDESGGEGEFEIEINL
jgi:hypothetical protein